MRNNHKYEAKQGLNTGSIVLILDIVIMLHNIIYLLLLFGFF